MEDITTTNDQRKPIEIPTVNDDTSKTEDDDGFEEVSTRSQGLLMTPTFAEHDLDFIFDIYPHPELNADLGGRQLLYGERYFPEMVLNQMLKEGDSPYNSVRYDGYMYY